MTIKPCDGYKAEDRAVPCHDAKRPGRRSPQIKAKRRYDSSLLLLLQPLLTGISMVCFAE